MLQPLRFASILAALVCACTLTAVAQPVLSTATIPTVGLTYTKIGYDTTNINPGAGGADVIWDFSQLTMRTDTVRVRVIAPTAFTPTQKTTYPSAQYAVIEDSVFSPFSSVTGFVRQLGVETPKQKMVVSSANTLDTRPTDLTFNQQHNDAYGAITTATGIGTPLNRGGSVTVRYDGFGTLILRGDTLRNVGRLYSVHTAADTLKAGNTTTVFRTVTQSVTWYQATSAEPVLSIGNSSRVVLVNGEITEGPVNTPYAWGRRTKPTIPTSVDEDIAVLGVIAPNPVSSGSVIDLPIEYRDGSAVLLVDAMGRMTDVTSSAQRGAAMHVALRLPNVATGTYSIVVVSGASMRAFRCVVN